MKGIISKILLWVVFKESGGNKNHGDILEDLLL